MRPTVDSRRLSARRRGREWNGGVPRRKMPAGPFRTRRLATCVEALAEIVRCSTCSISWPRILARGQAHDGHGGAGVGQIVHAVFVQRAGEPSPAGALVGLEPLDTAAAASADGDMIERRKGEEHKAHFVAVTRGDVLG